jgi:hypothetical protein
MSLDQIIEYTKLFQDIELATAVSQLKKDPAQLQQFLQGQQSTVFNDVTKQKDATFQKVYGDLTRASQSQESILMYDKRNKELAKIQNEIYDNQKNNATAVSEDKALAGRKYEMNEWSVNNKRDTIFIFSMLLIVLTSLIILTVLWRMGMISATLWVAIGAPIILIFLLTLISRSQYTNVLRDQRYWNRRRFPSSQGPKIPIPVCGDISGLEGDISSIGVDITQGVQSAEQSATQGIQSAEQSISNAAQSTSQDIQSGMQSASQSMSQMTQGLSSDITNLANSP